MKSNRRNSWNSIGQLLKIMKSR